MPQRADDVDPTFDDVDQAEDQAERDGIDVRDVNRLSRDYSTFFAENRVAGLLDVPPERVLESLANELRMSGSELREAVRGRAAKYLSRAKRHGGGDRTEAAQAAAVEILKELPGGLGARARVVWHERYETTIKMPHAVDAPDLAEWLEQPTFFTELRRPDREGLQTALWPDARRGDERERYRERELRAAARHRCTTQACVHRPLHPHHQAARQPGAACAGRRNRRER